MKVVIITQGISSVFESVLESKCEVVGIVECAPREEPPIFAKAAGRSLAAARYLSDSKPSNLKLFAKKLHVPYYYLKKEDSVNLEKWMKNLEPDLLVVYSMSHLLEENILRIPT